ncbi:MAG: hypothetical protein ACKPKO_63630, partial [Candidatus Fonsibacter sp.]
FPPFLSCCLCLFLSGESSYIFLLSMISCSFIAFPNSFVLSFHIVTAYLSFHIFELVHYAVVVVLVLSIVYVIGLAFSFAFAFVLALLMC